MRRLLLFPLIACALLLGPSGWAATRGTPFEIAAGIDPIVAGLADGGFVVLWDDNLYGHPLHGQRYSSDGSPAGGEFQPDFFVKDCPCSVAGLTGGGFVVVWGDSGDEGYGSYARVYGSDGSPLGPAFRVGFNSDFEAGAALSDGGFVVAFSDQYGIHVQRYSAIGGSEGHEIPVTGGLTVKPAVAGLARGGFVVAWATGGRSSRVYAQRFDSLGRPRKAMFQVGTHGEESEPTIAALSDGDFIITFVGAEDASSPANIFAQQYRATGVPRGGEFLVNSSSLQESFAGVLEPDEPSVAALANGGYVVTFTNYSTNDRFPPPFGHARGIRGRLYNKNGKAARKTLAIRDATSGDSLRIPSTVAGLTNGDVVIVWSTEDVDSGSRQVYGQRFTR